MTRKKRSSVVLYIFDNGQNRRALAEVEWGGDLGNDEIWRTEDGEWRMNDRPTVDGIDGYPPPHFRDLDITVGRRRFRGRVYFPIGDLQEKNQMLSESFGWVPH